MLMPWSDVDVAFEFAKWAGSQHKGYRQLLRDSEEEVREEVAVREYPGYLILNNNDRE